MREYTLTWTINWWANSPEQAAKEVLDAIRDPNGTATIFRIEDPKTGKTGILDIQDPDAPDWIQPFREP